MLHMYSTCCCTVYVPSLPVVVQGDARSQQLNEQLKEVFCVITDFCRFVFATAKVSILLPKFRILLPKFRISSDPSYCRTQSNIYSEALEEVHRRLGVRG